MRVTTNANAKLVLRSESCNDIITVSVSLYFMYIFRKRSSSTKLNRSSSDFGSLYIFHNALQRIYAIFAHVYVRWDSWISRFISPDCDTRDIHLYLLLLSRICTNTRLYPDIPFYVHQMDIKSDSGDARWNRKWKRRRPFSRCPAGIVGNCSLFANLSF